MRSFLREVRNLFRRGVTPRRGLQGKRRLELEPLEDRCLLATNVAPMLSGRAFIDRAGTGRFQEGDPVLLGVTVTLTGTTFLGTQISATTTTGVNGNFQFTLVPNGTYQLSFPDSGFLPIRAGIGNGSAPNSGTVISEIAVRGGQSLTGGHLAFRGIDPRIISERMFLASSTASALPGTTVGAGSAAATGPFVRAAGGIPSVHLAPGATHDVDLAGAFSAPDITTSLVTMNISAGGKTFALQVQLFDAKAPQTVANFLDYVHSGAYKNSIFHRLTSLANDGLAVLQGGGAVLHTGPTTLAPITITNPGVANEFSTSNTAGTLAMAQTSGNPNSATDQFFFNLVDNAGTLDGQLFTVFGKVVGTADQQALDRLAKTPVHDESGTPFATGNPVPGVGFGQLPLNPSKYATNDMQFPTDTKAANYIVINSIQVTRQNEALTYSVTSSNPNVATATIAVNTSELLTLQGGTATGSTTITVTATDQFGTAKQTSFEVTNP
jgi:cyclophilin family peptidyl-prolyl cis-trans isomerase